MSKKTIYKVARLLASLVVAGLLYRFEKNNGKSASISALSKYATTWGVGGTTAVVALVWANIVTAAVGVVLLTAVAVGYLAYLTARRKLSGRDLFNVKVDVQDDADDADDHDEDDEIQDAVNRGPDNLHDRDDADTSIEIEEVPDGGDDLGPDHDDDPHVA